MKKKLLLSAMLLAGWGLSAIAQETQQFNSVADCWIRSNNLTWKQNGSWEKVEIRKEPIKEKNDEGVEVTVGFADFAALYGFEFSVPTGMKVQSATVRFVTERWKGCPINLYGYPNDFVENTTWGAEENYLNTILASDPLMKFTPVAQRNVSLGSDAVGDDYRDISAWTNMLDVTNYVQSLPASATRVNFFLTPAEDNINQNCLFTREAADIVNAKDATLTFAKEDLVPLLIVTFVEDADQETTEGYAVADTWIRSNNLTWKPTSGYEKVEIRKDAIKEKNEDDEEVIVGYADFAALYGFEFEVPFGMEVESATVRFVTERWKGGDINVYGFENNFNENATWNSESEFLTTALGADPLVKFTPAAQRNAALGSDAINEGYRDIKTWTNTLDITNYVQSLPASATRVNLLLASADENTNQNCLFTREATDVVNAKDATLTFAKEDLWPKLTVIFRKKEVVEPEKPDLFCGTDETTQSGRENPDYDICIDSEKPYVSVFFPSPEEGDVYYRYELKGENQAPLMGVKGRRADTDEEWTQAFPNENYDSNYHEIILPSPATGTLYVKVVSDNSADQTHEYSFQTNFNTPTSVEEIEAAEAVAEYFTLQGVKVANPERGQIYIKVVAGKASKIIF